MLESRASGAWKYETLAKNFDIIIGENVQKNFFDYEKSVIWQYFESYNPPARISSLFHNFRFFEFSADKK